MEFFQFLLQPETRRGKSRAERVVDLIRTNNVTTARSVYQRFVEFEENAAEIYLHLASRFRENSSLGSFWLDMALHEKQHAGLLQFCLCEGLLSAELPDKAKIQKLSALFRRFDKRAVDPNITVEQALALAIELESSELNAIYCHLTTILHAATYLLKRKIATFLPDHVDSLVAPATKFGVAEDAAKQLGRLKKRCSAQWATKKVKSRSSPPV
jgi:hypothetical protein